MSDAIDRHIDHVRELTRRVGSPEPGAPTASRDWLTVRGQAFHDGIQVTALDPFQGYKNAINDQLEDATCVL